MTDLEPAPRFIQAQAWWIGSELARRNSELLIIEAWPNGGFYHGLEVRHSRSGAHTFFNFDGSLHLHDVDPAIDRVTWPETLNAQDPHEIVRIIETRMGWGRPAADATTRRSLTYRLFAALLALKMNDRKPWGIAHGYNFDGLDYNEPEPAYLQDFVHLARAVRDTPREFDGSHLPLEHTWVIKRGGSAVAVVTDRAALFTRESEPVDLMGSYARRRYLDDVLFDVIRAVQ